MKKIIALAVAGAFVVPVYAADVSVSGDAEFTFNDTDAGNSSSIGDADVVVTGSEELSNGMSVSLYITLENGNYVTDTAKTADGKSENDAGITLSGAFGTIDVGNDTDLGGDAFDDVADVAETGAGDDLDVSDSTSVGNSVQFQPNLGVEGLALAIGYAHGASADNSVIGYGVQYSVAGFTVAAGQLDEDSHDNDNATHFSASYGTGPFYAAYESRDNTDGTQDQQETSMAATYNYGPGKLYAEVIDAQANAESEELRETVMGASYKIGGAVNVYLQTQNQEEDASTESDTTSFGIEYSF